MHNATADGLLRLLYPDPKRGLAWTLDGTVRAARMIFTSQVMHDVEPFRGEDERFTFACDCGFTLPE